MVAYGKMTSYTSLQNFYGLLNGQQSTVNVLDGVIEFWAANKEFWFSHSPIADWPMKTVPYVDSAELNMSLLLHYDQIYRHPNPAICNRDKATAARFATAVALKMLSCGQYDVLGEWQQIFVLLALRHNANLNLKQLALKKLLDTAETQLQLRFLSATVWDIHVFKQKTYGYVAEPVWPTESLPMWLAILEPPKMISGYKAATDYKILHDAFMCVVAGFSAANVAVSISGGVDSMVAAYIMKDVCAKLRKTLILLHISYNNRDCCDAEIDFLRHWSTRLGCPLYVRRIDELQRCRSSGYRAVYEEITRRIRFSFYAHFDCPVVLGHNLDDCYENVFSNLSKKIHFDNLFGMSVCGMEDGVNILRPLLAIPKSTIVAFADHSGIRHLYDSTPAWSCRGRMRDGLIPAISAFSSEILPGLGEFVKHSARLSADWAAGFSDWCGRLPGGDSGFPTIVRDGFFERNCAALNFWVQFWNRFGGDHGSRPSNKSFNNLIEALQRCSKFKKSQMCTLNSKYKVHITAERIIILTASSTS